MGALFGKSSRKGQEAATLSVKDKAVLELKVARDRLDKAKRKHEAERDAYVSKAREMLRQKKKSHATLALRLKKMRETQIDKLTAQLLNLEQLVQDVEWAQHQNEIVEGMKAGNLALKELQLDVDEVEQIMADSEEAREKQREVEEILHGTLDAEAEEAVLAELEEIEKQEAASLDAQLPDVPSTTVGTGDVRVETPAQAEPAAEERQAVLA